MLHSHNHINSRYILFLKKDRLCYYQKKTKKSILINQRHSQSKSRNIQLKQKSKFDKKKKLTSTKTPTLFTAFRVKQKIHFSQFFSGPKMRKHYQQLQSALQTPVNKNITQQVRKQSGQAGILIVTSPSGLWSILSMPLGPREVRRMRATALAA